MKKVLLIQPPVTLPLIGANFNVNMPLGLAYIAAALEKAHHKVVVLDAVMEGYGYQRPVGDDLFQVGMPFEEIRLFVQWLAPDFVGINSMFTAQSANAHRVAGVVKSIGTNIPVIVGGAYASAAYLDILKDKNVDYVIIGEGEYAIVDLLAALEGKLSLDTIERLVFRRYDGTIQVNPPMKSVDIDKLPLPARHLLPIEKYFTIGERLGLRSKSSDLRSMAILATRGCPYNCNFCVIYKVFGRKARARSAVGVLDEIKMLVKTHKANDIYFADDSLLFNPKRFVEILDGIISADLNISLDAPSGISPWLLTEEIVEKMKLAGFWRIILAIESGNQWVLDNIIGKPVKIDKLPMIVEMVRKYNFEVEAFFVFGNVEGDKIETFSQMRDSFDLMRRLGIKVPSPFFLTPHIGTRVEETVRKKCYPTVDSPKRFYYDEPHFSTPEWSADELSTFVKLELLCLRHSLDIPLSIIRKLPDRLLRVLLFLLRRTVKYYRPLLLWAWRVSERRLKNGEVC